MDNSFDVCFIHVTKTSSQSFTNEWIDWVKREKQNVFPIEVDADSDAMYWQGIERFVVTIPRLVVIMEDLGAVKRMKSIVAKRIRAKKREDTIITYAQNEVLEKYAKAMQVLMVSENAIFDTLKKVL